MQIFVKRNGTATVQLNRDVMYYANHIARDGKIVFKGTELADFLSQGFGWYRVVSDRMSVALQLIRVCIRRYRKARDAESRALLAMAAGVRAIAVSYSSAPFVTYTLEPQVKSNPRKVVHTKAVILPAKGSTLPKKRMRASLADVQALIAGGKRMCASLADLQMNLRKIAA